VGVECRDNVEQTESCILIVYFLLSVHACRKSLAVNHRNSVI
jgi:hypothetical protein